MMPSARLGQGGAETKATSSATAVVVRARPYYATDTDTAMSSRRGTQQLGHCIMQSLLCLANKKGRHTYLSVQRQNPRDEEGSEGSKLTNNIPSAVVTVQRCGMYHHTCRNRQDARPAFQPLPPIT